MDFQAGKAAFWACCAMVLCGCFRQDVRTVSFDVPQMKATSCGKIVLDALTKVEGIVTAVPDIENHKVHVTYNSTKLAIKNIENVIATAGFNANTAEAPQEARAALPPECR